MKSNCLAALVPLLIIACALTSAAKSKHSVTLTWQAPKSEKGAVVSGYNIYRKSVKEHAYKKIASRIATPPYEDTEVKGGQTYIYAVAAIDQSGHESPLSEISQVTVPSP